MSEKESNENQITQIKNKGGFYKEAVVIDKQTQLPILSADNKPLIKNWQSTPVTLRISKTALIKNNIEMFFYFGIYAVLIYITAGNDYPQQPVDEALQAFLLPILGYFLISYRSLGYYIRAIFIAIILMGFTNVLLVNGVITYRGVLIFRYILPIVSIFNPNQEVPNGLSTPEEIASASLSLYIILFTFEFILLIIKAIFKRKEMMDYYLTQKNLYVRSKTKKKGFFSWVKLILMIIISPFNVSQYKEMYNSIKHQKLSEFEGSKFDIGEIPIDAIKQITKKRLKSKSVIILSIIFIIAGFMTMFIPLSIVGFIVLIKSLRGKNFYKISVKIHRSKCSGSWFIENNSTEIIFELVPEDIAKLFKIS